MSVRVPWTRSRKYPFRQATLPEFGQAAGGYFNYTMKVGTNIMHGGAYEYFVNEAFNAGLPFTNAGTTNALKDERQIRPVSRKNDFGGTFGRPIPR